VDEGAPRLLIAQRLDERGRWLLFTHQGRVTLAVLYSIASVISIVTYSIMREPLYGLGQFIVTGFGLWWARWCLRRS
jgi:hypothetical protein